MVDIGLAESDEESMAGEENEAKSARSKPVKQSAQ
jgi:hypothetical protein